MQISEVLKYKYMLVDMFLLKWKTQGYFKVIN